MPDPNPDKFWEKIAFSLFQIPTFFAEIDLRPGANPDKKSRSGAGIFRKLAAQGENFGSRPKSRHIWSDFGSRPVLLPTNSPENQRQESRQIDLFWEQAFVRIIRGPTAHDLGVSQMQPA
ncbi:hypothetical protein FB451DRAFT_1165297 [Mycena latifolia]|nr:hypothetical protein FB451DRAFT_1165297 [Mycena latifolia]